MEMEKKVTELAIEDILPNRFQPRIKFNETNLNDLAVSIKEHGVIQPIVVRPIGDKYEIIAGERRYKASILANKRTIPAIITNLDDKESAEVALIENVQRQDLTPIEEAISYHKILDMGYLTQDQLATKLGKSQSTVANKLRLLNLAEEVQEALLNNKISERHARSLLRIADPKKQVQLLNQIVSQRLTVRRTDEVIAEALMDSDSPADPETAQYTLNDMVSFQPVVEPSVVNIPSNVEVLDFKEIEEKGDQMNHNQTNNPYNFPTEPIIDDVIDEPIAPTPAPIIQNFADIEPIVMDEVTPVQPIVEEEILPVSPVVPVIEEAPIPMAAINPGFVDVDQIESQAQDIYQPKQPADLSSLLQPTPMPTMASEPIVPTAAPMAPQNQETPSEKETAANQKQGKFFNFFGSNSPDSANSTEGSNDSRQFVSNLEDQSANMDFGVNDRSTNDNANTFHFDQLFNPMSAPTPASASVSGEELEPVVPVPTPVMVDTPPSVAAPAFTIPQPSLEIPTPIAPIPASLAATMPAYENMPKAQNNYALDPDAILPIEGAHQAEESRPNVDMRTVINLIRDCSSQIERYGYTIDTEEIDFDTIYQVTFRIEKK